MRGLLILLATPFENRDSYPFTIFLRVNMKNTINMGVSKPNTIIDKPLTGEKHPRIEPDICFCEVDGGGESDRIE